MSGNIYIPKPCHENWNKMTPEEKGRHCAVCSKVVTDFTKMKTEEIATTIQNSDKEVCGRINIHQLTPTNKKQQIYFWIKGTLIPKIGYTAFAIFGLAAIFKKSAYAQALPGQVTVVNGGAKYEAPVGEKKKVNIEVVNEINQPVPGASVVVNLTGSQVLNLSTNDKGLVSGEIEMQQVGYSFITITVNAKGYESKIVSDVRINKNGQTIRVKLDENVIMMGKMSYYEEPEIITIQEVEVTKNEPITICRENVELISINPFPRPDLEDVNFLNEVDTKKITFNSLLDINPNKTSFVAFPNPTIGDVTIETKQEETFDIRIYNENGALILTEISQYKRSMVQLQNHAAGTYFAIIFVNNKAVETHKLILVK